MAATHRLHASHVHHRGNNPSPPRRAAEPAESEASPTRAAAGAGVMGVALDETGGHSTMPPRNNGGNMDIKQLTRGTTLFLPVWVDGALFSIGDGHAAQGDGEVCITAVEMNAQVTIRFGLEKARGLKDPQLRTRGALHASEGPHYATMAMGPDLFASSQQ